MGSSQYDRRIVGWDGDDQAGSARQIVLEKVRHTHSKEEVEAEVLGRHT